MHVKCRNGGLKPKMEVKAINITPNFRGHNSKRIQDRNKSAINNDYPQMDAPVSKESAEYMKNVLLGLAALGAASCALSGCSAESSSSAAAGSCSEATSVVIGGGCNHKDTIIKPITVKDYPYNIGDSLVAQGINIGIDPDGPIPDGQNNAVYMASTAHNRYDNKIYKSTVDSIGTSSKTLAIFSEIEDRYDDKNPKKSYMKTVVSDVPGRGIKLMRYVANTDKKPEEYEWNYAGYEVRSNGRDGKRNIRSVFDKNGNLVYRGDIERGQEKGTFLYGSVIYDDDGNVIKNDKGEPEFAQYDFDNAKVYSDYARTYTHKTWNYDE